VVLVIYHNGLLVRGQSPIVSTVRAKNAGHSSIGAMSTSERCDVTGISRYALAPYLWFLSVNWCLAEG